MFWSVDLVKNRKTKEPFNTFHDKYARKPLLIDQVAADLLRQKVSLLGWVSHLVIAPPLIITEAQLDECVAALDVSLKIADEKVEA
jgi:taurine--2-oxoglutarate transaminase